MSQSARPPQSSQSARPPQSAAPADPRQRPPQSAAPADPRQRPQQRPDMAQPAAAAAAAEPFDARSLGVAQRRSLPRYTPIDANTKKVVPSTGMLQQAASLSLKLDKPIILTFWHDSIVRNVVIRDNREEREKIIYKITENPQEEEEFTSPIILNQQGENPHGNGIFETQNSIYIVVPDIQTVQF
jgi:hypothetical protein